MSDQTGWKKSIFPPRRAACAETGTSMFVGGKVKQGSKNSNERRKVPANYSERVPRALTGQQGPV